MAERFAARWKMQRAEVRILRPTNPSRVRDFFSFFLLHKLGVYFKLLYFFSAFLLKLNLAAPLPSHSKILNLAAAHPLSPSRLLPQCFSARAMESGL